MAFALCSNITIGQFTEVFPHSVKVNKSIHNYCDTAVIEIPATARLIRAGVVETVSASTAELIDEGMAVNIQLGYNGILNTEFVGFVRRVDLTTPCKIECEGYSYQLRIRSYQQTFNQAQLIDILKFLIPGTGIVLDTQIPHFLVDTLVLKNHSGTEVLELIKKISEQTVCFFFTGNVLYAGLIYLDEQNGLTYNTANIVKYQLGWNVINDDNLKLREAKNQDVTVEVNWLETNGTKQTVTKKGTVGGSAISGTTGETKVLHVKQIKDVNTMQGIANAKHNELSYDGYEGKITAFLFPFCKQGDKAAITDLTYPQRAGNYLVEAVEVTFGMEGARRIPEIGFKL